MSKNIFLATPIDVTPTKSRWAPRDSRVYGMLCDPLQAEILCLNELALPSYNIVNLH